MKIVVAIAALGILTGCASITSESTQLIRVDALDEAGVAVKEATCVLRNDKGEYSLKAGQHTQIGKSSKDLNITCVAESREDEAIGTAISRVGAGMFGNIVFGGGIGAIIDHNRGTAYNYPEWVQVVFGKIMIFDRSKYKSGSPMKGEDGAVVNQAVPEE